MTDNKFVLNFIDKYRALFTPDEVVWVDGSKEQHRLLTCDAIATGEVIKLSNSLMPGCLYRRTDPDDAERATERTFICTTDKRDAGITNNWMSPDEAREKLDSIAKGSMKGRTMYVIPFSMAKIGSPFAEYGIEITDSLYVVLNMAIMTRVTEKVYERVDGDDFVKCIHCTVNLDPQNRYICHFPEDNVIYSINSEYGGNAFLGKECFALRMASYRGREEGRLAEHMSIFGVEKPNGETKYVCAAFPSEREKTDFAMLVPPEIYRNKGYKIWTVGNGVAWIRKKNGTFYAVNPENGFFGIATGTNEQSDPNALATMRRNTIFTNVCFNPKNNTVWWEGSKIEAPKKAIDRLGRPWHENMRDENGNPVKGAHPNGSFTAPAKNCPCLSPEFDNGRGVPISAIIFCGSRTKVEPLVYEARDWEHGVFVGATMSSETVASDGKTRVALRNPMGMMSFCGYNMCDYFAHWLKIGVRTSNAPKIFRVNLFGEDNESGYIGNGFDEMRALDWIIRRCDNEVEAVETPVGLMPKKEDIYIDGTDVINAARLEEVLDINISAWKKEAESISEFFDKFGDELPEKLAKQLRILKHNLRSENN